MGKYVDNFDKYSEEKSSYIKSISGDFISILKSYINWLDVNISDTDEPERSVMIVNKMDMINYYETIKDEKNENKLIEFSDKFINDLIDEYKLTNISNLKGFIDNLK